MDPEQPTIESFGSAVIAGLRDAGASESFQWDGTEHRLIGERGHVVNLIPLYQELLQLPIARRPAFVELTVRMLAETEASAGPWDQVRPQLRPKLWTRATLATINLRSERESLPPLDIPATPLGEHLLVTVVIDLPASMRSLTHDQLKQWNVTFDEVLAIALANLEHASGSWATVGQTVHSSLTGDHHDAARLLLPAAIDALPLSGDPVAMVPTRDTLLVTEVGTPSGLSLMTQLAEAAAKHEPNPLLPLPLIRSGDAWADWTPPANHIVYPAFRAAEVDFFGRIHAEQALELTQIDRLGGSDRWVAPYSVLELEASDQGRRTVTYCVWPETASGQALLPRTDWIVMMSGTEILASGPWDRVAERVGDRLQLAAEHYPSRFTATGFPDRATLESIGLQLRALPPETND